MLMPPLKFSEVGPGTLVENHCFLQMNSHLIGWLPVEVKTLGAGIVKERQDEGDGNIRVPTASGNLETSKKFPKCDFQARNE